MSRGGKFFFFGLTFLLFFGGLLFVLGDFGKMHWLFDLVSHFQLQYFIFFLFCALVFWFANYHAKCIGFLILSVIFNFNILFFSYFVHLFFGLQIIMLGPSSL